MSSLKDERIQASKQLKGPQKTQFNGDKTSFLEDIRKVGLSLAVAIVCPLEGGAGGKEGRTYRGHGVVVDSVQLVPGPALLWVRPAGTGGRFANCNSNLRVVLQALYASKIISYAQGFMLLRQVATEFGWTLNYGSIALMWRGGCIIRRSVGEGHGLLGGEGRPGYERGP